MAYLEFHVGGIILYKTKNNFRHKFLDLYLRMIIEL